MRLFLKYEIKYAYKIIFIADVTNLVYKDNMIFFRKYFN